MRFTLFTLAAALSIIAVPAIAQRAQPEEDSILVEGKRTDGRKIAMSDWSVAETDHVLVYARGPRGDLTRVAHNLEKLHFLLSMLLNRVDEPDFAMKLRVTLIGDQTDFDQLHLESQRWQYGPYPNAFPPQIYYDPRENGPVLATTLEDQKVTLEPGWDLRMILDTLQVTATGSESSFVYPGAPDNTMRVNENAFDLKAEQRLYAGYAKHYLMTYFPAAYPRWYLDGFGEIFATLEADRDGHLRFGEPPEGFREVTTWYGNYPLEKLLDGSYLEEGPRRPRWTPYHAWQLVHMLFFSDEWKQPLHDYLAALGRGESPKQAAAALGDVGKLKAAVSSFRKNRIYYHEMDYPPSRAAPPLLRQLTASEAEYMKGRLLLDARVDLPPLAAAGADADTAARMARQREKAIARRDSWLAELRRDAARYPEYLGLTLLLAEAECRSGNDRECAAAADRVLAADPQRSQAMLWKGVALTHLALAAPESSRKARLREARALIARANRLDDQAVEPLLAYYRSFAEAGERAPEIAVLGLVKASEEIPSAPTIRLMLGSALVREGRGELARQVLMPVANGGFDSPERTEARALLSRI